MFKIGISGDLLNSNNQPCFGRAPLELIKKRDDIEISWMDKDISEINPEMSSKFDAILRRQLFVRHNNFTARCCPLPTRRRF